MSDVQISVVDNPDRHRFEIHLDGDRVGIATYRLEAGLIRLVHTEVDPAYGGRGLAGILVRHALDEARDAGLAVLPDCPYVRRWIAKHHSYLDLVPVDSRAEYDLS